MEKRNHIISLAILGIVLIGLVATMHIWPNKPKGSHPLDMSINVFEEVKSANIDRFTINWYVNNKNGIQVEYDSINLCYKITVRTNSITATSAELKMDQVKD